MRSFLLLASLLALVLGFAGTALGVRPRPAAADTSAVEEQLRTLTVQVDVLTQALEDLEQRFDDHRARTPVDAGVTVDDATPVEEGTPSADASAPVAGGPSSLVLAALERAEDHVLAGDARGARELFRTLLARTDLTAELRVRTRLGIATSWEILEAWAEATAELDRAEKELDRIEAASAGIHRTEIAEHRKRIASRADED